MNKNDLLKLKTDKNSDSNKKTTKGCKTIFENTKKRCPFSVLNIVVLV
jgi:hypothetical protein